MFQWVTKVPLAIPHAIVLFLLFMIFLLPNYGAFQLAGEIASRAFTTTTWYFWHILERGNRAYTILDYVNQLIPPFIATALEILILAVTINLYMKILGYYFMIYPKTKVDSYTL